MTMRPGVSAIVGSVMWSAAAAAQVTPAAQHEALASKYVDPVAGVTLEEAITHALDQEPSLRAARTDVDIARGRRVQAGLRPNPTVSFARQDEPAGTDSQTRVEIEWPLDLFRKSGRVAVAERELEAMRQAVSDRARLLAADVRMKYGELVASVREVAVSDDLITATARHHELLRARVEEGATPPLERDMLRVELQRVESERLLQAGRTDRAMIELKRLLGMSIEAPFRVRETLEQLMRRDAAGAATAESAAVPKRPDVQEAEARIRVADARIDRARREGRVDVSLFGMYMRMDAGFPQRGFDTRGNLERVRGRFHYLAGGAMVMVPLRNRNQGEITAAQAERAGAAARLDAAQLTAQAEIAAARARDDHAQRAVAVYSGGTRMLARQNLDVVGQTYELGPATVFDVLAEQRRYLDVERAFTNALREAYEARTALRRALGELP